VTEVVTGEAVVLEVPCARFPSRLLAIGTDVAIQGALLLLAFGAVAATAGGVLDAAGASAVVITLSVLVIVGYPVTWETLTRGRSPGKYALGLRVVSDDGGPERFRQALVRALVAVLEIWTVVGMPAALLATMLSPRGKRLGDLFAGTFVIQQRLPARRPAAVLPAPAPQAAAWAASLEMSGLSEQTAEAARRYLARLPELAPAARAGLGQRIAAMVSGQVSPPPPDGMPPEIYLSAVLAERRNREHGRLTGVAPPTPAPAVDRGWQATAVMQPGTGPGTGRPLSAPGQPPTAPQTQPPIRPPADGQALTDDQTQPDERPGGQAGGFTPPA
jgi:uncharacterized RDD family membrane protein YckC